MSLMGVYTAFYSCHLYVPPISLDHFVETLGIALSHDSALAQIAFTLWGFLFENVAGVAMISFNLTGTGLGKRLAAPLWVSS